VGLGSGARLGARHHRRPLACLARATPEELIAHVRVKIARYKAPREVDIVVGLPKTSTGKIQKFVLREPEWAGRTRRVHG
jgi:fatty-acyl-CoA synthase